MILSPQQSKALQLIQNWYRNSSDQIFILHGYAGTGKTTIANTIVRELGLKTAEALYMAYTGKAAMVLKQKGCENTTTIHQSLYRPAAQADEALRNMLNQLLEETDEEKKKELRKRIAERRRENSGMGWSVAPSEMLRSARLVIIDECSMLDQKIMDDLVMSTTSKFLLLGDPGQLPPVRAKPIEFRPSYTLTEIHRQAADNPLLRVATMVRNGEPVKSIHLKNDDGEILISDNIPRENWLNADQIIVGRNATRKAVNNRMRKLLHDVDAGANPVLNEKVVILRNNHDIGIFNGMVGRFEIAPEISFDGDDKFFTDFRSEGGDLFQQLEFSKLGFTGDDVRDLVSQDDVLADYGYALTCHKAQGSEWDNVAIMLESGQYELTKWLYTAITRARKNCKILLAK